MDSQKKGQLMMVICATLWSTSGVVMKYIDLSPFLIGGGRAVFSTLTIAGSMIIAGNRIKVTKQALISMLVCFANLLGFVIANKLTTAANAIVLEYWAPIYIILALWIFWKEKPEKYELGFVGVCFLGMVLFFMDQISMDGIWGNLLAIFAGANMGTMYIINGKIKYDNERMTAIVLGHALTAVVGVSIGIMQTSSSDVTLTPILLIIALGIFQMGIPYILYGRAAAMISPVAVSLINMIEPILNQIWVALFYGEKPGIWALVGAVIIICAVGAYSVIDAKKAKE